MVGGDAVTLCKAQNAADGNAVDDLSRGKPVDLAWQRFSILIIRKQLHFSILVF